MPSHRQFLHSTLLAASASALPAATTAAALSGVKVVSTWDFGVPANRAAWEVLGRDGSALDAVEAGAR
jgi:N4-(beta-N-acetylglucosaminyl)-L-asparaginase